MTELQLKFFTPEGPTPVNLLTQKTHPGTIEIVTSARDADVIAIDTAAAPAVVIQRIKALAKHVKAGRWTFRGALLLDASMEGVYFTPSELDGISEAAQSIGVDPARVLLLTQDHSTTEIHREWAKTAAHPFSLENYHAFLRWTLRSLPMNQDARWRTEQLDAVEAATEALFLNLNRRMRWSKKITVGHWVRTGALDKGLVSALITANVPATPRFAYEHFKADLEAFDTLVPNLPLRIEGGRYGDEISMLDPQLYRRSLFSVVSETEASDGRPLRFTEKSIKPMMCGHLFLVVGNPHTLSLLRSLGFETFDGLVDESYDTVGRLLDRIERVLVQADRLISLGQDGLRQLVREARGIREHNMRHAAEYMPELVREQDKALLTKLAAMASEQDAMA